MCYKIHWQVSCGKQKLWTKDALALNDSAAYTWYVESVPCFDVLVVKVWRLWLESGCAAVDLMRGRNESRRQEGCMIVRLKVVRNIVM